LHVLLRAHDNAANLLDKPPVEPTLTSAPNQEDPEPRDLPPGSDGLRTRIGPYKLLNKLGEGGMGTVYLAEQEQPVQRQVALKIIKAGMDSAQVIARFEQERQALAVMDHPNIAKVLDAGTTNEGRPYYFASAPRLTSSSCQRQ
jgi:eukaryotic-like serine/threonine-protein kinase